MRSVLLSVFLLLAAFAGAQSSLVTFRQASAFSGDEACLLRYLDGNGLLVPRADRYYLLHRDSSWLVDQAVNRGDTLRRQWHVTDGRMGFLNTYGEWIIAPEYDDLKPHGLGIWVKNAAGTQIIDAITTGGKTDIYDRIETSMPRVGRDARITMVKKGNKVGAIGPNRKLVVPLAYDNLHVLSFQYLLGVRNHRVTVLDPVTGRELTPFYDDVRIATDRRLLEVKTDSGNRIIDPYHLGDREVPEAAPRAKGRCSCGEPEGGDWLTLRVQGDSIVPCREGSFYRIEPGGRKLVDWAQALRDTTLLYSNHNLGKLYDCSTERPLETVWRNYYVKSVQGKLWVESAFEYDSLMPNGRWKEYMAERPALREVFRVRNGRITRRSVEWILRVPKLSPEGIAEVRRLHAQATMNLEENFFLLRKLIVAALNGDAISRDIIQRATVTDKKGLLAYYQLLLRLQPRR
ncbi:MAG: WG repeat-containing protein [Chitinophagaceae bacterium]|nr:MAG: WG repeat-containing protein [Chitinophagaceae bacterium]